MSKFSEVKDFILSLEDDFEKFYVNGNKAAGTRVRNGMMEIKKMSQDIRNEVSEIKKSS